jgi:hypothetical protein
MSEVRQEMDALRLAVGETEALAAMLLEFYDSSDWSGFDQQLVGRVGHVLGALAESATRAVGKFERFEIAFVDAQPVPVAERWTDDGTAPGPGEGDEDAAIIRRIRERCPDKRFDGGTDAELLDLFKRNRQVLQRSDDDVIAVMVRAR